MNFATSTATPTPSFKMMLEAFGFTDVVYGKGTYLARSGDFVVMLYKDFGATSFGVSLLGDVWRESGMLIGMVGDRHAVRSFLEEIQSAIQTHKVGMKNLINWTAQTAGMRIVA